MTQYDSGGRHETRPIPTLVRPGRVAHGGFIFRLPFRSCSPRQPLNDASGSSVAPARETLLDNAFRQHMFESDEYHDKRRSGCLYGGTSSRPRTNGVDFGKVPILTCPKICTVMTTSNRASSRVSGGWMNSSVHMVSSRPHLLNDIGSTVSSSQISPGVVVDTESDIETNSLEGPHFLASVHNMTELCIHVATELKRTGFCESVTGWRDNHLTSTDLRGFLDHQF